ncbi:cupin domain-containing protein [Massilia sp. SYSU DXS3249]
MYINADFSRRAVVAPQQYQWVASPQAGVERVMLDRIGEEKARATSIVRYAPASDFPRHLHPGGEEILVLSGVFSDEHDDFPEGWYLRNPPGSSHRPSSRDGALIFVKLWQMAADDTAQVRIDTRDPAAWRREGARMVCPLFASEREQVSLQRLEPGAAILEQAAGGAEVLVLAGSIEGDGSHGRGTWMRFPPGEVPDLVAGPEGVSFYLKTGHLAGDQPN